MKKIRIPEHISPTKFRENMIFCVGSKVAGTVYGIVESKKGNYLVLKFYDKDIEENLSNKDLNATFLRQDTLTVQFEDFYEEVDTATF